MMRSVWLTPGQAWRLRFSVMLALSVVIAVAGLTADSPALVIGAMLVAPLMSPVLGFSVALSMGWPRHMGRTATTVVAASAGSVALAWLLASTLPSSGTLLTHELVSRTAPTVLDLLVALAAGAAGAYATVRDDASAALPGVAVAVALVPPLAAAGVTLQLGQTGLAKGAILLYAANLVAIVLASVGVLLVSGFVPLPRLNQVRRQVIAGIAAIAAATVALAVVLTGSVRHTVDTATTLKAVNAEVVRWLGTGTDLAVRGVSVMGTEVVVQLAGSKPPPPTSVLAAALVQAVGPNASVQVRWSQRTSETAPKATVPGSTTLATSGAEALRPAVEAWLAAGSSAGSEIVSLSLTGNKLTVEVGGPVPPPEGGPLATAVAAARGKPTDVTVRWTPRQEFAASSGTTSSVAEIGLRARQAVDAWAQTHPDVTVLGVSVVAGVATVDLAAETSPPDVEVLTAALRSQAGVAAVVRLAPLRRLTTGGG